MGRVFALPLLLVLLAGIDPAVAAEPPPVPCGSCIVPVLTVAQARLAAAASAPLSGLTILVTPDPGSPDSDALRTAASLRDHGARVGIATRNLSAEVEGQAAVGLDVVVLDLAASVVIDERVAFAVKTRATGLRAANVGQVGILIRSEQRAAAAAQGLAAYVDFLVTPDPVQDGSREEADRNAVHAQSPETRSQASDASFAGVDRWTMADPRAADDPVSVLMLPSRNGAVRVLVPLPPGGEAVLAVFVALSQLVPAGLAPLPAAAIECDRACDAAVFLDAATLDAVAVVRPSAPVTRLRVVPTAASIEILMPSRYSAGTMPLGAETIWRLSARGRDVLLPAVADAFLVRARGWQARAEEGFATGIDVSASRTLRVEEIVARHQAAEAAAKRVVRNLVSSGETVLTFEAPGFAAPLAITAATTVYTSAAGIEVVQRDVRVNGLALSTRGDEVPRLPLIEPERVTIPPLAIALTEAYTYRLEGQETLRLRTCYLVGFRPRVNRRTLFAGRAWIDAATFGLVRIDATQSGLPGPVVTSREIHDFEPETQDGVTLWLPSRSEIHQAYETAAFATPIHRVVTFGRHLVNPPDFAQRLEEAYRSDAVMMRDTPQGYRYLRRAPSQDSQAPGGREVVADRMQRVRTVAGGVTIDPNISIPLVFAGISYVNFNVRGTGAQIDAFFGGT